MDMKVISTEARLCTCCMEEHEVKTVLVKEKSTFKDRVVFYDAVYSYCDKAEELYASESQLSENDKRLKDAYRAEEGLLTSSEIVAIRSKYGISQRDLSTILGWGAKTITRYETHQVQDKAHDAILKKIDDDPEWFISLLLEAKEKIALELLNTYLKKASILYEKERDAYLRKAIEAEYVKYVGDSALQGNTQLSLDKVIDVIRYFASNINNLYKVKLMKLMWYADAVSYKQRGAAITGLVYLSLPMGAVPVGHKAIIDLKDVPCEEVPVLESSGYLFRLQENGPFPNLSKNDVEILNYVIDKLGKKNVQSLVEFMHNEQAYKQTAYKHAISFEYVDSLQI